METEDSSDCSSITEGSEGLQPFAKLSLNAQSVTARKKKEHRCRGHCTLHLSLAEELAALGLQALQSPEYHSELQKDAWIVRMDNYQGASESRRYQ